MVGASIVAGIGFTVSLFIASLAFEDGQPVVEAKVGVLLASLVAGLTGAAVLAFGHQGARDQDRT
ncbi:MAG: Na+/H+ antiporter NhaA [Actinomycetota bacterium]|nr:Na+/H+ antiporter NhaA [Actinomycetota bacterium]